MSVGARFIGVAQTLRGSRNARSDTREEAQVYAKHYVSVVAMPALWLRVISFHSQKARNSPIHPNISVI